MIDSNARGFQIGLLFLCCAVLLMFVIPRHVSHGTVGLILMSSGLLFCVIAYILFFRHMGRRRSDVDRQSTKTRLDGQRSPAGDDLKSAPEE